MNRRINWMSRRIGDFGRAVAVALALMAFARSGEVQGGAGRADGADDPARVLAGLPAATATAVPRATEDWLVQRVERPAGVYRSAEGQGLILDNGLIRRAFRVAPNGATVGLDNLMTGASLLRSVKPEAVLTIDGRELAVGGLQGQPNQAYLRPEWIDGLTNDPAAFQLTGSRAGQTDGAVRLETATRRAVGNGMATSRRCGGIPLHGRGAGIGRAAG